MDESMELNSIENNNISVENVDKEQDDHVAAGNGGHRPHTGAALPENDPLLAIQQEVDGAAVNSSSVSVQVPDAEPTQSRNLSAVCQSAVDRVKEELNKQVVWKLRLWMVLLILLLVIVLVIILSVYLSIVLYKDPDDKFDVSSYVVPRVFNGSLSVVNQSFSKNTTALSDLATQVTQELNELYHSSHALERYFNNTRVKTLRPDSDGSVIVEFCLMFRMPLDSDLLLRYTLSQEMVSGVLRQHLYDQDSSSGVAGALNIQPASANLQDGGSGCTS